MVFWCVGTVVGNTWTRISSSPQFKSHDEAAEWLQVFFKTNPKMFEDAWRGNMDIAILRFPLPDTENDKAPGFDAAADTESSN